MIAEIKRTKDDIQKEVLDIVRGEYRCGAAISMGVGKTLLGLKYLKERLDKSDTDQILIVVPLLGIITDWMEEAKKFGLSHLLNNGQVSFCLYRNLNNHNPTFYNLLILDECHSLKDSHRLFLQNYRGGILGFTGTPPIPDSEKGMLVQQYCPIIYTYSTDDAVSDKILNDYKIVVHLIDMNPKKDIKILTKNGGTFFTSEVAQYEYWTKEVENAVFDKMEVGIKRMSAMKKFESKERYINYLLPYIKEKCLIFANTKEQASKLSEFTYLSGNKKSEQNLDLFKSGAVDLLACNKQLSMGTNIPYLKHCIIMHSHSNEFTCAQQMARALRLNPEDSSYMHILCYDNSVDVRWVQNALTNFDQNKIKYVKNKF